ncbi:MAG: methyltransferase domain-containing protein [Archaeoglobaceae archaeon]
MKISNDTYASLQFTINWKSKQAKHTEVYHGGKVNLWRDVLPQNVKEDLEGKEPGDVIHNHFTENIPYNPQQVIEVERNQFNGKKLGMETLGPHAGRYYPMGILKLPGIFPDDLRPFRCVGTDSSNIKADFNHPFAGKDFELKTEVLDVKQKQREVGGSCNSWLDTITEGPGMQARWDGVATDFFTKDAFTREDEQDDSQFYQKPRLTTHLDDKALENVRDLYGELLEPGMDILDLMSGWRSHIPDIELNSLTGLALNEEEMKNNPQLTDYVLHDVNRNPRLPFEDNSFDAIVCTSSVEYVTKPLELFKECARVLRTNGVFINVFSNRWFPPKVVKLWTELQDFERMGLVLEYYLRTEEFDDLETYSVRGYPRPVEDSYFPQVTLSDPIYAVWGRVSISN